MNNSTVIQFIVIAIAAGTPLVFGSVGEILCEKAGSWGGRWRAPRSAWCTPC